MNYTYTVCDIFKDASINVIAWLCSFPTHKPVYLYYVKVRLMAATGAIVWKC